MWPPTPHTTTGSFLLIMPTQGLVSSPLCALLSGALAPELLLSGLRMCLIQVLLDRMGEAPPQKVPMLSLILLELRTSRVKVGL